MTVQDRVAWFPLASATQNDWEPGGAGWAAPGVAGQGQVKRREGHVGGHIVADPAEVAVHGGGRADADEDVLSGSGRGSGDVQPDGAEDGLNAGAVLDRGYR